MECISPYQNIATGVCWRKKNYGIMKEDEGGKEDTKERRCEKEKEWNQQEKNEKTRWMNQKKKGLSDRFVNQMCVV